MALDTTTQNKITDWYTDYMNKQNGGASNPFSTAGYTPSTLSDANTQTRTISAPTETVAGQMDSLLGADSSYLQRARAGAMQTANSRGLLNSSMAATAGEAAAIDAALPIAQADAGTYKSAGDYNTSLFNEAAKYNTDQSNTLNLKAFDTNANLFAQQQKTDADRAAQIFDAQSKTALQTQQLEADKYKTDATLAAEKAKTDATITADAAKSRTNLLNNILMTTDLSPDRKAALLTALNAPELAKAIYVVDSTTADLTQSTPFGNQESQPWYMQGGGEGKN